MITIKKICFSFGMFSPNFRFNQLALMRLNLEQLFVLAAVTHRNTVTP